MAAGIIDAATADRIRAFETARESEPRLRWPTMLAAGFGALLLGAGVLLFVAAHWDAIGPAARFSLVLALVGLFHVGGAVTAERTPLLAAALHLVGTVSLGAGIYLAAQIFNMAEHWPAGVLLWTMGSWVAWLVLRHDAQLLCAALLTPAWCASEWLVLVRQSRGGIWDSDPLLASGLALLALAYFTVPTRQHAGRQVLVWLGAIALVPGLLFLVLTSSDRLSVPPVAATWLIAGILLAVGGPMLVALTHRRRDAWINGVATAWVAMLLWLSTFREALLLHGWWALGALGLVAWGVREHRSERINMGAAMFGITVLVFYFSRVMDKLGRSASLVGLGLLFLAGGWALERTRRQLVRNAKEDRP